MEDFYFLLADIPGLYSRFMKIKMYKLVQFPGNEKLMKGYQSSTEFYLPKNPTAPMNGRKMPSR